MDKNVAKFISIVVPIIFIVIVMIVALACL